MKRLTLILIVAACLTGTASAQQAGSTPAAHTNLPSGVPPAGMAQFAITSDELMELHTARSAAINAHPDLITENQMLMERMHALNDKINAAMIKIDPGVAPIIAKVEANRNRRAPGMAATPPPANPPPAK
jgi:hypothetical protein